MFIVRPRALVLGAILVAPLLVGCNKPKKQGPGATPMPIPATTAPNGWLLYEKPTEGFALTLPPDWKHYDRTKESVEEMLKKAEQRNPEMGHSVGGLEAQLAQAYSF